MNVGGIIQLGSCLDLLKGGDYNLAKSLMDQFQQKGRLSDRQIACIPKLLAKAEEYSKPKPTTKLNDFSKIIQIFDYAKEKGYKKSIKLRLGSEDYKVCLSEAPASGINAGMVYVKANDQYKGKISRDGDWQVSGLPDDKFKLQDILNEFSQDPKDTARKYGKVTGRCCVCNRHLTDPVSIANSIGPKCSEFFNL